MAGLRDFSIEWIEREMGLCVLCSDETGVGPVGWHKGNPIGPVCDRCLGDAERGLGALMRTINLIREVAIDPSADPGAYDRAVCGLMTWAYLYHRTEAWPARQTGLLKQLEQSTDGPGPDLFRVIFQAGGSNGEH